MNQDYRFAVYRHTLVIENGLLISRNFIVLKDSDNHIMMWTDFDRYLKTGIGKASRPATSSGDIRFFNACTFLNYLFFDKELVDILSELVPSHIEAFLNDYAMGRDLKEGEKHRSEKTINTCIRNVLEFAGELSRQNPEMFSFEPADLYMEKKAYVFIHM